VVDRRSQTNCVSRERILKSDRAASATDTSAFSPLRRRDFSRHLRTGGPRTARCNGTGAAGHPDESGCGTYEYVRHNAKEVRKRKQTCGGNRDLAIVERTEWKRSF
jgi:hypothetical protein